MKVMLAGTPYELDKAHIIDVPCPRGYRRVFSGIVLPGDLTLDFERAISTGDVFWRVVAHSAEPLYADEVLCVLREGSGNVVAPCERCACYGRAFGLRFCGLCAKHVINSKRKLK